MEDESKRDCFAGDRHAAGNGVKFEALIAELSSRFISRPADEVGSQIDEALRLVCEFAEIDLAVLWQFPGAASSAMTPTHVCCVNAGGLPAPDLLAQCQALSPWVERQMLAGSMVAGSGGVGSRCLISSLDEFQDETNGEREPCRLLGIKSALILTLSLGGESPVGALSLNALRTERVWPDALVKRLQLVAQVFTNALARSRHQLQLQESKVRLAAGAELAGLGFYEVDFCRNASYVDDQLRHLCGIPTERGHGLDALEFWVEHLHPDDRERILDVRRRLHDGRLNRLSIEYRFMHPVHGEMWIQHLAGVNRRDASGCVLYTYGVLRDVSERKRVENELRDLSRRLIRAQENERALLARELHDDVTQRLAVLAIAVGRAELSAPDGTVAEAMQEVRQGLMRLSEDVHALAYQLHPSVLEELGLAEALRAECERRVRLGWRDLSTKLDPLPAVVGKDAALCLFRVAQEALNNVVRHAGECAARVTLRQVDGGLLLAVSDDGAGFDPAHPRKRMQLGLVSMRERVRLLNGSLDIESAPRRGTTIVAWVPAAGELR
jgi:PAS domain S-box-containing protein